MKPIHLAFAAGAVLMLAGCATMAGGPSTVRAPEPARSIEPNGFYVGRWYEIARTPMKLTDGCVAGYTDYITEGDRLIERDGCRDKTPMGKEKVIAGPLTILNPGQNTKVRVDYRLFGFVPIAAHLLDARPRGRLVHHVGPGAREHQRLHPRATTHGRHAGEAQRPRHQPGL